MKSKHLLYAFYLVASLALTLMSPAQQTTHPAGIVQDWSTHHVVFSNPGTFAEAMKNGSYDRWIGIVTDPRYRMQQMKRHAPLEQPRATDGSLLSTRGDSAEAESDGQYSRVHPPPLMQRDWSVTFVAGNVAADMYPAKYSLSTTGTPDCTNDFAVFPVNTVPSAGNGGHANFVGFNNLYVNANGTGYCSGTAPNVIFAYAVGTFPIQTSPSLSLDGTKVAFIESRTPAGSVFHVLTVACTTCGTLASPVAPASGVDAKVTISGSPAVTRSSVYVDYGHDVGYMGDDLGVLHKFYPVFTGTPAECTSGNTGGNCGTGWPVTISGAGILTGPTYDSGTGNVFVGGGATGNMYSVPSTGTAVNHTATLSGASNCTSPNHLVDATVVDTSTGMLYTQVDKILGVNCTGNPGNAHTYQLTTSSLASSASVTMIMSTNEGNSNHFAYDGAFDQTYFNDSGKGGHMYFCMNGHIVDVTFNGSGVMTADTGDLVLHNNSDCSPVTEFYDANMNTDWIWAGNNGLVLEMNVTSGFPGSVAQSAAASGGTSGIVPDNDYLAQPLWQANHSYASGNLITDSNGDIEDCTIAGTSGSTQPAWCTKTVTTNCVGTCNDNFGVGCVTKDGTGTLRWANQGPPGTASIYLGTLSGNSAVKLTQTGLQ